MGEWKMSDAAVFTELDQCLVLTCPPRLSDQGYLRLREESFRLCSARTFRAVIIDLSAVELLDLEEWGQLLDLERGLRLIGSKSWLVGLRPALAGALIMLGAEIDSFSYAQRVEDAILSSRS